MKEFPESLPCINLEEKTVTTDMELTWNDFVNNEDNTLELHEGDIGI